MKKGGSYDSVFLTFIAEITKFFLSSTELINDQFRWFSSDAEIANLIQCSSHKYTKLIGFVHAPSALSLDTGYRAIIVLKTSAGTTTTIAATK